MNISGILSKSIISIIIGKLSLKNTNFGFHVKKGCLAFISIKTT